MSEFRGRELKIIIAVFLLSGSFLFFGNVKKVFALINDYNKPPYGTLQSTDWNNLPVDFLNKNLEATMTGPLGIGTTDPGIYQLNVNGSIYATNFSGESVAAGIDAANVMGGNGSIFGSTFGSGANYSFSGNVGIGTATPGANLEVYTSVVNPTVGSALIKIGNPNGNIKIGTVSNTDATYSGLWYNQVTPDATNYFFQGGTNRTFFNAPATGSSYLNFRIGNDTKMTVLENGSVGIGTPSPGSKLTLSGGDFEIDHNKSIKVSSSTANTTLLIGNYEDSLSFVYGTSTSAKTASLAVEGDVKADRLCIEEDCKAAWSEIVFAGGGGQWLTSGNNIYNANSGNVGIGTTNPGEKLAVAGNVTIRNDVVNTKGILKFGSLTSSINPDGIVGEYGVGLTFGVYSAGATGKLGSDSKDVMTMLQGSGNVGIGTTNPNGTLHTFRSTDGDNLRLENGWSNTLTRFNTNGTSGSQNIQVTNAAESAYLPLALQPLGGNVGIGTTNSTKSLVIQKNVANGVGASLFLRNDQYSLGDGAETEILMGVYSESDLPYRYGKIHTVGGGVNGMVDRMSFGIGTNNTTYSDYLTIKAGGNVGIGTTAPLAKLYVSGGSNSSDRPLILKSSAYYEVGEFIGPDYPSLLLTYNGGNTSYISNYNNLGLALSANTSTWSTADLFIKNGGNVGIGQTNPTVKLQITGGGIDANGTVNGTGLCIAGDCKVSWPSIVAAGGGNLWGGAMDGNIWNGTSGGGNVGIGTTDPGAKLHIGLADSDLLTAPTTITRANEYLHIGKREYNTNSYRLIGFGYTRNATIYSPAYIGYQETDTGGETLGDLIFGTRSVYSDTQPSERMRITSGGNVGIGATNPLSKLDVLTTLVPSVDTYSGLNLRADNYGYLIQGGIKQGLGGTLIFSSNQAGAYTERIRFDNNGNVGIGTTNPGAKLQLSGTADNAMIIDERDWASKAMIFFREGESNAYGGYVGYNALADGLQFNTLENNVEKLGIFIDRSTGNIGINQTNPTVKLQITGGGIDANGSINGTALCIANDCKVSWGAALGGYLPLTGGTMSGDLLMGGHNINMGGGTSQILDLYKLTVMTIDPLYKINGINYSTFASSISGGVKEEIVGMIKINNKINTKEYEAVIDFSTIEEGSDLWVWRKVVDFSKENVEVLITPYGEFANAYYLIENNKLIFRADSPIEISYRLIGKRFDWRKWPTKAIDQNEKGMVVE